MDLPEFAMNNHFTERSTRKYVQKQLFSKEELNEIESRCSYEDPAFCAAACPMKLDGRAFVKSVKEGKFKEAAAMLHRITPFPLILAKGCSHPCTEACRLSEIGDGIDIPALERAVCKHITPDKKRGLLRFKKKKTAAVFGASLFTLTLAAELERKSYPCSFYIEEESIGASVKTAADFLDEFEMKIIEDQLSSMDIKFFFGEKITPEFILSKKDDYDILGSKLEYFDSEPDELTLMLPEGIIAASSNEDVLESLWGARRAAATADRLAQNLNPADSRGEEGPVDSRLYTDLGEAKELKSLPEGEGYSLEDAQREAGRCIECECKECRKSCVYLREFGTHPRMLTREIYNNTGIIMGDHMMNKAMNSCSLCGQCTYTCPFDYDMAFVALKARENMVDTQKLSLAVHEFALLDMLFSNGDAFFCTGPEGSKPDYLFFPGCQAAAAAPEHVMLCYELLLEKFDPNIHILSACCGEIARMAGRRELYEEQRAFLEKKIKDLENPLIIAACPSCLALFTEWGLKAAGIWEILLEHDLAEPCDLGFDEIYIHDACASRFKPEIQDGIRALVKKLGLTPLEAELGRDKSPCCGFGGLVQYANPEMASLMAADCLLGANDKPMLSYCMACRDRLARQSDGSLHLFELILNKKAQSPPDITKRRENRLALKRELIKKYEGEEILVEKLDFKLEFKEEVREKMEERMILLSDIIAVIKEYRKTRVAARNVDTGLLTANLRLLNVTFWIEFEKKAEDCYLVHRAYSHRMKIVLR